MGSIILLLILQARQKRVVFENISIVRRRACWAPGVILNDVKICGDERSLIYQPICFIKYDDFMAAWGKCHFLLSKSLYFISNHINSTGIIKVSIVRKKDVLKLTAHQTHSIPAHLLYMHPPTVGEQGSVCSSFYLYQACPGPPNELYFSL